jgi:aspartate aminotransferase
MYSQTFFVLRKTLRGTLIKDNDFTWPLGEANVATVTDAFGNPDCIRFSYATSEEILKEALKE